MSRRFLMTALMVLLAAGIVAVLVFALPRETPAPAPASPNAPSSTDLVERPKTWNEQEIPFTGEAIGEVMERGEYAWIHLNDDAYYAKNVEEGAGLSGYNSGMAVWIPTNLTDTIGTYGDYKHEGDIVKVQGVFNAACAQHGGDMDIHATSLAVVTPGRHAIDQIRAWKVALAILLALLALVLWQAERRSTLTLARGAVTRSRA